MKHLLTVSVLLSFLLLSCSSQDPVLTFGVVVSKHHEPEKNWIEFQPTGLTGALSWIPVSKHQDESWTVTIRGVVRGKEKNREVAVSEEVFEKLALGDTYIVEVTPKRTSP